MICNQSIAKLGALLLLSVALVGCGGSDNGPGENGSSNSDNSSTSSSVSSRESSSISSQASSAGSESSSDANSESSGSSVSSSEASSDSSSSISSSISSSSASTPAEPEGYPLEGSVQKGPFEAGSTVTLVALTNGAVDATATPLETTVDEQGRYHFEATGIDGAALLRVSGFWFDENTGLYSDEPTTLRAVVDVTDGEANVNVLTDLISERLQQALGAHGDDYPAALSDVMEEYRALTGLGRSPASLDMLKGFIPGETLDLAYYQETRLLPVVSAAVAAQALPNLADARAGFADEGAQNEQTQAFWTAMWEGYAGLISEHEDESTLMTHVQTVLSEQYPFGDGEAFPPGPPIMGGMQSVLVGYAPSCSQGEDGSNDTYNRRICSGADSQTLTLGDEYQEAGFYLDAPAAASYIVRVTQSSPVPQDAPIVLEYRRSGSASTSVRERCENYGNCSVATDAMREGDRAYFRLYTNGEERTVQVSATRLGDGHPQAPMIIDPANVTHYGRAGSRNGASVLPNEYGPYATMNSYSHYHFHVMTAGKTLVVDEYLCGPDTLPESHRMYMLLAKLTTSGYTTVRSSFSRGCDGFRYEIEDGETGVYYLRMHPDYDRAMGTEPSSAGYDFRIRLLP